jgi:hypothetical protein
MDSEDLCRNTRDYRGVATGLANLRDDALVHKFSGS